MSSPSHTLPAYVALHAIQAPRSTRVLSRVLVVLMIVMALALTITPWQQNIAGSGRVVAFSPEERQQNIEAPIDGRIARWYVVEGSDVKKGDPIVDLTDNDPSLIDRLTQEREEICSVLFDPSASWTLICVTERPDLLSRCNRLAVLEDGDLRDSNLLEVHA